jgi:hypothetical protein
MTYKSYVQILQHRATVHPHTDNRSQACATVSHRAADRSWARWPEATTRQDEATIGYDTTGWSYVVDRSPRVKTDRMGHAMCRSCHHYPVPTFNALASV